MFPVLTFYSPVFIKPEGEVGGQGDTNDNPIVVVGDHPVEWEGLLYFLFHLKWVILVLVDTLSVLELRKM